MYFVFINIFIDKSQNGVFYSLTIKLIIIIIIIIIIR